MEEKVWNILKNAETPNMDEVSSVALILDDHCNTCVHPLCDCYAEGIINTNKKIRK